MAAAAVDSGKSSVGSQKRPTAAQKGSVLENLPSPRKRPLEERLEQQRSDSDEKMNDTGENVEGESKLPAKDDSNIKPLELPLPIPTSASAADS